MEDPLSRLATRLPGMRRSRRGGATRARSLEDVPGKEGLMTPSTRREFLADVGRGMLVAGLGATLTEDLGFSAMEARLSELSHPAWSFAVGEAQVLVFLSQTDDGGYLQVVSPVSPLPAKGDLGAVYQRLLELNAEELLGALAGIKDEHVVIMSDRRAQGGGFAQRHREESRRDGEDRHRQAESLRPTKTHCVEADPGEHGQGEEGRGERLGGISHAIEPRKRPQPGAGRGGGGENQPRGAGRGEHEDEPPLLDLPEGRDRAENRCRTDVERREEEVRALEGPDCRGDRLEGHGAGLAVGSRNR